MKNRKKTAYEDRSCHSGDCSCRNCRRSRYMQGCQSIRADSSRDLISKEEYVNCMNSVEYDTKIQIQQDYDAVYGTDFWEKQYDGQYGYEILARNTIEQLKYIHAVYDLAEENGDVEDSCYEALENAGRTAMQSGVRK